MRKRLLVLGAFALLAICLPAASSSRVSVVGGQFVDIHQAPWTVFVVQPQGDYEYDCTGSILDATTVLTAAHCLFNGSGQLADPSTMIVYAGISNVAHPLSTDEPQMLHVASGRVHPGYVPATSFVDDPDDVAVLTLASPIAMTDVAQPIALAPATTSRATGAAVGVNGFGQENPAVDPDGTLNHADLTLPDQTACGPDNAVLICAQSPTSVTCEGDSGGGLVVSTPTVAVLGVTDYGEQGCPVGSPAYFANLAAPEIAQFVQGNPSPPTAPRQTANASVSTPSVLDVGSKVVCNPGQWSGAPTYAYTFADQSTRQVLQTGPSSSYTAAAGDVGRTIECVAAAQNAGGTGIAEAAAASIVQAAPTLHVSATVTGHPGKVTVVPVVVTGGVGGPAQICAYPAAAVAARTCVTGTPRLGLAATGLAGQLRIAVRKTARPGRTSMLVSVTVVGRKLQVHASLVIKR